MRAIVFTLVFLFCFAVSGFAAGNETVVEKGSILKSAAEAVRVTSLQADKVEWQQKLDQAEARRSRGLRYAFVGAGVGILGSALAARSGSYTVLTLMGLGSAGLTGYGAYNWMKGVDEVDKLDREGRSKGFLSFRPTDGGARVAMNFSF